MTVTSVLQVCKVYIGSFNADKPIRTDMNPSGEELFQKEQSDLLQDLFEIPQRSCDRKVTFACCKQSTRVPCRLSDGMCSMLDHPDITDSYIHPCVKAVVMP